MPVPATLTSYLPVLLVSVSSTIAPDDSSLSTCAQGQVDYLSHDWREEDVWRSWRSMTRQKNAIANGMRLENASWRTWWKQRNKLKTISPETLNWLKDSDVTWLYGPLHVGSDWSQSSAAANPRGAHSHQPFTRSADASTASSPVPNIKKPILKRRSIGQLLSLPTSPFFDQDASEEDDEEPEQEAEPVRPPLMHTKSDTHISCRPRAYRKDSPPRVTAVELQHQHFHPLPSDQSDALGLRSLNNSGDASHSTGSEQDLTVTNGTETSKKRHISFNTYVEQCIAIEKPKPKRRRSFVGSRSGRLGFFPNSGYDDGYDEDSEVGYDDDESDGPSSFYIGDRSDSDDEDDDDVLEMRTSSSRSRSSSSSRSRQSPLADANGYNPSPRGSGSGLSRARPPLVRQGSTDRERVTIAPIAPTILKTIGVGNDLAPIDEGPSRVTKGVELVYAPPSNYSLPPTPDMGAGDIHHRDSYFGVGGSSSSLPTRPSPIMHNIHLGPSHVNEHTTASSSRQEGFFGHHPRSESPQPTEDAYDYFGGPDLGEDFSDRREQRRHSRRQRSYSDAARDDDLIGIHDGSGMLRYAQGGAASVTTGRSRAATVVARNSNGSGGRSTWPKVIVAQVPPTPTNPASPNMPSVIVDVALGAIEERMEHSPMSTSPVLTSPLPPPSIVPITIKTTPVHDIMESYMGASLPCRQDSDSAYLSPSDANAPSSLLSSRGRSPQRTLHSGSTTTGSYSYSSDSRSSESRGRSSRTSSFSDQERSNSRSRSRSSRGTNSPMGSISPTGSTTAMGVGTVDGRGRERDRDKDRDRTYRRYAGTPIAGGVEEQRGRDRSGRRLGESLSPPNALGSPATKGEEYRPFTPELLDSHLEERKKEKKVAFGSTSTSSRTTLRGTSPPASVSGSSTASSTIGPPTVNAGDDEERHGTIRAKSFIASLPIPSPIPEEEETRPNAQVAGSTRETSPLRPTATSSATVTPSASSPATPTTSPTPVPTAPTASSPPYHHHPHHHHHHTHSRRISQEHTSHHRSSTPKVAAVLPVTCPSEATAVATMSPPSSPITFRESEPTDEYYRLPASPTLISGAGTGTLAGRAAEIVSSARGFLGSIWGSGGGSSGVPPTAVAAVASAGNAGSGD